MSTLITGATGFIGKSLAAYLSDEKKFPLMLSARKDFVNNIPNAGKLITGNIDANTEWDGALKNIKTVIHAAGIAHRKQISDEQYQLTHVVATEHLARRCITAGVKQFIYISTIGVHGKITEKGAFSETSPYNPSNEYALSKQRAEQALKQLCASSPMNLTVLRPPLVYAVHAPGNFSRLLSAIRYGIPLPVGGLNNHRSMMALDNLLHLIQHCIGHEQAFNEEFVLADTAPALSTEEIIQCIASGMQKSARSLHIPRRILSPLCRFIGQQEKYLQLCCDLEIDTSKTQQKLGWKAPYDSKDMFIKAGRDYLSSV